MWIWTLRTHECRLGSCVRCPKDRHFTVERLGIPEETEVLVVAWESGSVIEKTLDSVAFIEELQTLVSRRNPHNRTRQVQGKAIYTEKRWKKKGDSCYISISRRIGPLRCRMKSRTTSGTQSTFQCLHALLPLENRHVASLSSATMSVTTLPTSALHLGKSQICSMTTLLFTRKSLVSAMEQRAILNTNINCAISGN